MILTVRLSPAWQHIFVVDRLQPGEVNRAAQVHRCASGKSINVARALHRLGVEVTSLTVAGGPSGCLMRDDLQRCGLAAHWVETASTHECTTLVESHGRATELVENALELRPAELQAFYESY